MINIDAVTRNDAYVVELLGDAKHSIEDFVERKVRSQCLVGDIEAFSLESLAVVGDVPSLELAPRKAFELFELSLRDRSRPCSELFKEAAYFRNGARHLRGKRVVRIRWEADERGQLASESQDLGHQAGVVPALGRPALIRCARDPRGVELLSQRLGIGVHHDRL